MSNRDAWLTIKSTSTFVERVRRTARVLDLKHATLAREAVAWRLSPPDGDEFYRGFRSDPGAGPRTGVLRVQLDSDLKERVSEAAAREGLTISAWVESAIIGYLEMHLIDALRNTEAWMKELLAHLAGISQMRDEQHERVRRGELKERTERLRAQLRGLESHA